MREGDAVHGECYECGTRTTLTKGLCRRCLIYDFEDAQNLGKEAEA